MTKAQTWKKTEDPSAKVISALTTKVNFLEEKLNLASNNSAHATTAGNPKLKIPVWRTEKKGDSVQRDGKTWWWCPHHKKEGLFDGLYMTHKPSEHDEWSRKQKEFYAKKKNKSNSANGSNASASLTLTDSMKQALMTQGNMSEDQAKACWAKVVQGN